jgi:esterase/lipase
MKVTDFNSLTAAECIRNISELVDNAAKKYDKVYGIGISLGGAFLLEHAKNNTNLDGIVSVGTPFRLKNQRLIRFAQALFPLVYPAWKRLQKLEQLRLLPVGAGNMVITYLQKAFLEKLDLIEAPVLFLHSKKDPVTDYLAVEKFSAQFSSVRQESWFFENGNHVIDNDSDLIIKHSLEFFDLQEDGESVQQEAVAISQVEELTLAKS